MAAPELKTLGRYRIERVLGKGAMGVVYEGFDPRLGRRVAIKTILKSHLDEGTARDYSARFEREAQALGRLTHPHIVQVHDFGEEGEIAYLVMEFVKGRDLKGFFDANERFDLREAVRIMAELCEALDFAHRAGIIHRDVKPGNVMLDAEMRAKLTDFGVARLLDPNASRMTQAGTMVGTPAYMSPEQITGRPVDARTDVFSAGIILYQFLTGEMPFTGAGAWTIAKKIMQDEPAMPSSIDTTIGAPFDAVVAKALAKQPEQRYQSAKALGAALRQALEGRSADDDATVVQTPGKPAAAAVSASPQDADVEFWRSIKDGTDARGFELYLDQFPNGIYAKLAQHKLASLRATPAVPETPERVAPPREEAAKRRSPLVAPLVLVAALAVLGAGGWFAWKQMSADSSAKTAGDAGKAAAEEKAAAEKLAAAKAAEEKAQAEKLTAAKLAAEKAAAQAAEEKAAKDKQLAEKQAADKAAQEKAAQDKAEAARFAAAKAAAEKELAERSAAEKKAAADRARLAKVAEEEAGKAAKARAAAEKAAAEKAAAERALAEKAVEQARLAKIAEEKVASIQPSVPTPAARPGRTFRDCDVCPEMVTIPAGSFTMGSPESEPGRFSSEGPQHQVTISRSFAAGKYEVTFDEWDACVREGGCSHNPSDKGWGRGRRPVINVSWNDSKEYVAWLSRKTGKTYRLLSEAEWEYVARAGTTTAFSFGAGISPQQANYDASVHGKTVAVGSYAPNAFGLYDVHGNVWEWVEDCLGSYAGAPSDGSARTSGNCGQRVLRGGSWAYDPPRLRSADRVSNGPAIRYDVHGLRVVRTN